MYPQEIEKRKALTLDEIKAKPLTAEKDVLNVRKAKEKRKGPGNIERLHSKVIAEIKLDGNLIIISTW